jgi:hypothetical protein
LSIPTPSDRGLDLLHEFQIRIGNTEMQAEEQRDLLNRNRMERGKREELIKKAPPGFPDMSLRLPST